MIIIATTMLRWTMLFGEVGYWRFRWCGGDLREWVGDEVGRLEGTVGKPGGEPGGFIVFFDPCKWKEVGAGVVW